MKILFVCIGNICRSPIAEGVLTSLIQSYQLNWSCDSAATHSYHIGNSPHPLSQKVCSQNNIDISKQKSRKISHNDFINFDIIYALATDVYADLVHICPTNNVQKVKLLMNELQPNTNQSVLDPYYGTYKDYEDVFTVIEKCCIQIIKNYANPAK